MVRARPTSTPRATTGGVVTARQPWPTALQPRRVIALGLVPAVLITVLLVAAYYLAPLDRLHDYPLGVSLTVGVCLLVALTVYEVLAVGESRASRVRSPRAIRPGCDTGPVARIEFVPSPGAWQPPAGTRPAWNWIPPDHGLTPRLDRVPGWVRMWFRTPFFDRFAYTWMWDHGGWDIVPPSSPAPRRAATGNRWSPSPHRRRST